MSDRDVEAYEPLLHDDYWFWEPNELDSLNYESSKDADVEAVRRISDRYGTLTFDFVETRRWTEYGWDFPGEGRGAQRRPCNMGVLSRRGLGGVLRRFAGGYGEVRRC